MDLNRNSTDSFDRALDEGAGEGLRAVDWSALLARLGAERDLRRELARNLASPPAVADFRGGGAFVVSTASTASAQDAPSVNPDALADFKSTGSNKVGNSRHAAVAKPGARGQQ
jgi:hypothetical protein